MAMNRFHKSLVSLLRASPREAMFTALSERFVGEPLPPYDATATISASSSASLCGKCSSGLATTLKMTLLTAMIAGSSLLPDGMGDGRERVRWWCWGC